MTKHEIVKISCLSLVFILTTLTIRDLLHANHILLTGAIGLVTGLFAFWWTFYFIKNKTFGIQITYTAVYSVLILTVAFLFNREKTGLKPGEESRDNRPGGKMSLSGNGFLHRHKNTSRN
jgi:hypothetical protein